MPRLSVRSLESASPPREQRKLRTVRPGQLRTVKPGQLRTGQIKSHQLRSARSRGGSGFAAALSGGQLIPGTGRSPTAAVTGIDRGQRRCQATTTQERPGGSASWGERTGHPDRFGRRCQACVWAPGEAIPPDAMQAIGVSMAQPDATATIPERSTPVPLASSPIGARAAEDRRTCCTVSCGGCGMGAEPRTDRPAPGSPAHDGIEGPSGHGVVHQAE